MPQILQFSPLLQISMDRITTNRSNLARPELQKPTPHQFNIQKKKIDLHVVSIPKDLKRPSLTHTTQTMQRSKKSGIYPKTSSRDGTRWGEGVQRLWSALRKDRVRRSRMRSGRRDIMLEERWRMRRIRRILGWKNKREADMEDGSTRRKIWGLQVVFFWLYGSFNIFLFHTITTTIRYAIAYLSANDCVIIASVDYN